MSDDKLEKDDIGKIDITVTDSNVSYDSNLSLPELVFWIDMVKTLAIKAALEKEEV